MAICEVIKYDGDNSAFIWKHPEEDFNTKSQLIVHESQTAIFFMNGQAVDTFAPGRYTLNTQNIPIITGILKLGTGGVSPFHCEVYFINHTVQMDLKWGTDSKVRYIDPDTGLPLEIGACGSLNMMVLDGRKLIVKLVGTMNGIAWGENGSNFTKSIQTSFRPLISTQVKSNLSVAIKALNINLLEVDEHLNELSAVVLEKILPGFEEYGLTIPQFYLTSVVLPEDDPNFRRVKELYTVSLQKRMAQAEADVRTAKIAADAQVGTAQAQADATVIAAQRAAELERQATETEIARRAAERKIIEAQAEAAAMKYTGFAEAEVMQAQGYNQKDIIDAEVKKSFAEGLGNMGGGINVGGGSSPAGDMIGMMAGMKMAGMMMDQMGDVFGGINMGASTPSATAPVAPAKAAACSKCGAALPDGAKFCLECGEKVAPPVPDGMVICPSCVKTVAKGKFCPECGYKFVTVCPNCGKEVPDGSKFCLECGTKI